jgi:hypothetical protein
MVRWCEGGGVNLGLFMTISEEDSKWCKTEKKEESQPSLTCYPLLYEGFSERWRCVSIVNIASMQFNMNSQGGRLRYNGDILRCSN